MASRRHAPPPVTVGITSFILLFSQLSSLLIPPPLFDDYYALGCFCLFVVCVLGLKKLQMVGQVAHLVVLPCVGIGPFMAFAIHLALASSSQGGLGCTLSI